MSKDRSPNVSDRRSPRSPAAQKKRPPRVAELEAQLGRLQEEVKKAKDETRKARQEADEAKRQLLAMSEKLEESEKQLRELSESEEARFQELRKLSRDRDRAWESELDARQKLHDMDSLALSSAINQVQKLKIQLQIHNADSAGHADVQSLRHELTETLAIRKGKEAMEELSKAQIQLEEMESCKPLALELKLESRQNAVSLEEEEIIRENLNKDGMDSSEESEQLKIEAGALQIRSSFEQVEKTKSEAEAEILMKEQLKCARAEVEEVKATLINTESQLKNISEQKILEDLKAELTEKETQLQILAEENDKLKMQVKNQDAAQAARADMEAQLRRLKVQADQWRKAAEAAAGMLTYSEDLDDDSSPKKKNGNMLKKIGVLLKKGQK